MIDPVESRLNPSHANTVDVVPSLPFFSHPADSRSELYDLWLHIRRRGVVIVGVFFAGLAIAAVFLSVVTPQFRSAATVMFPSRTPEAIKIDAVLASLPNDPTTLAGEIQLLKSRGLAEKTIRKLSLDKLPEFAPSSGNSDIWKNLREWIKTVLPFPSFGQEIMPTAGTNPEIQFSLVVDRFLSKLVVAPEERSRVVNIFFTSDDRYLAAEVANTLTDLYADSQLEFKSEATRHATAWVESQLANLQHNFDTSEAQAEAYRSESGLVQIKDSSLLAQQLTEADAGLAVAKARYNEAKSRLEQLTQTIAVPGWEVSTTEVLGSQIIQQLRGQEAQMLARMAEIDERYGSRHPIAQNIHAELKSIQKKLQQETQRIIESSKSEVASAEARMARDSTNVESLKAELLQMNRAEDRLKTLQRNADVNRNAYDSFLTRFKELKVQENVQIPDIMTVSRAEVAAFPIFPNKVLILSAASIISLFAGLCLSFILEQFDHGLHSMDEVERELRVPSLGLVPLLQLRGLPNVPGRMHVASHSLDHPISVFSESVRRLAVRTMLLQGAAVPKTILFASSLPGEGKTTTSYAFARTLAGTGRRVLLIDADLRRPRLHQIMDHPMGLGFVDCLQARACLGEVIIKDPASGLDIIYAGKPPENPVTLLRETELRSLLTELTADYDFVVLDSAPILAASETWMLGALVDCTVFCVRWQHTRKATAATALRQLKTTGSKLAGVVLTMVNTEKHRAYGHGDADYSSDSLARYHRRIT